MEKTNGLAENVEIIPDFENEMIEQTPPKKPGCGCGKKAQAVSEMPDTRGDYDSSISFNWKPVLIGLGVLVLVYFLFKKKGKVEVPKVDVK